MKLWLLRPVDGLKKDDNPWNPGYYDKAFGFVVRAETEAEARKMAHAAGSDENRDKKFKGPWKNAKYSTCMELLPDGPAEVVMRDLAAA